MIQEGVHRPGPRCRLARRLAQWNAHAQRFHEVAYNMSLPHDNSLLESSCPDGFANASQEILEARTEARMTFHVGL